MGRDSRSDQIRSGNSLSSESIPKRGFFLALALTGLAGSSLARADGLLIPTDHALPPLSLTYERVKVTIIGQVATATVHQYLFRTGQTVRKTVRDFTVVVQIQSDDPLGPSYSPSHGISVDRRGDREAVVSFEQNACTLDKDFQLYFVPKAARIGVSMLTQCEEPADRGYFLLLLSPRAVAEAANVPRDLVVVVDTSGSMEHEKLQQAKAAVNHALNSSGPDDRFALIAFATTPTPFREHLAAGRGRRRRRHPVARFVGGNDARLQYLRPPG
jgi:hypothetical protein